MAEKWQKRLLTARSIQWLLSHVAAAFMRALYLSCRITRDFAPAMAAYETGQKQAIYIFWHGRLIMQPFLRPPREMQVLISHHNDGELISLTMQRFGIDAVRGSKKKGSSEAVRGLVESLERGANIAITPDGPRGPFQVAAPGAIYVAMRTGHPIIPISFSASRHWRLRSWDKFMIPKPFSHIHFVAGEPFTVPATMEPEALEACRLDMNARLDEVTARADRKVGL